MLVASLALVANILSPAAPELPYQELADRFLERHGLAGSTPEQVDLGQLLERDFFRARVGLFEVWIPAATLADKETARDYRDVCAALCEAQELWIDWLADEARDAAATRKEFAALRKWTDKWAVPKLMKVKEGQERTALTLFAASDEVVARSELLARKMQSGELLGSSIETPAPVRLVLMPERAEFVELIAFAGWFLPEQQASFWVDGIADWTELRLNDLQVIALQYPALAPVEGDYTGSTSMKDRDVSGLEQQVVQLAMNRLLAYAHGEVLPSELLRGMSISMLIELYGTCHTRNDGDLRGRQTEKREVFVRGGRSEGGQLPQNIAESRWRTDYGKHHYTRILSQVQKSGASSDKRNRHKYNSFLLVGDDENERFVLHAPVFGPGTRETEVPPAAVHGDHLEFLRAYNVAFVYWLQTAGAGSKKKSAGAFARSLATMSTSPAEASLAAILEEAYGLPLTNAEVDAKCLEGRFLAWLSKQ